MIRLLSLAAIVGVFVVVLSFAVRAPVPDHVRPAGSAGVAKLTPMHPMTPMHPTINPSLGGPRTDEERQAQEEAKQRQAESSANRPKTRAEADALRAENLRRVREAHPGRI